MENYEELEQKAVPEQNEEIPAEPAAEEVVQEQIPEQGQIPVQEQTPLQEPVYRSQPYSGAGVGRKESPFADSPYVMNHERPRTAPQHHYQCGSTYVPPIPPQPPVRPKRAKNPNGRKIWETAIALLTTAEATVDKPFTTFISIF